MSRSIMLTISAGEWEGIQHRPHHFMRRSVQSGWQVIYLEPPATLIAPLKDRRMLDRWKNWLKGTRKLEEGIHAVAPPPTLPFGNKYRWINKINQWLISHTVKKAIRSLSGQVDIYSFLPNAVDLIPFVQPNKIIYDCVDDHAAFTGFINKEVVLQMEKELMQKANVSFATAKQLMEDRIGWSDNFHLIPNGAEFERFAVVQTESLEIPEELKGIKHPVVGFIGGISDWIDIPLLTEVARSMPELTFVFVGPAATNVDELKSLPNVKMLGSKPYNTLPNYLKEFDTCLIPFKINKLTESVNPIKMYEYLSAGKPVVSTPLPEVLVYDEVVEIANNKEEMIVAINRTIQDAEKDSQRIAIRQAVGKENSWDARWQQAVDLINGKQAREHEYGKSK